jgi:hypothetical protein
MHPTDLLRGFIADVLRLPLFFKFALLYTAGAAGWNWWRKRKQSEMVADSATWPVHRARVVWADVSDRKNQGEDGPSRWEGLLTYSYTVPGHEIEIGEFRKMFYDEEEADGWARGLRDTYVDVRVDPADPKRSVWQETTAVASLRSTVPTMDGEISTESEELGLRKAMATVVLCASIGGAAVAGWIQLSCLRGHPAITAERNTAAFFGMHIGAMACGIASGFMAGKRGLRKTRWKFGVSSGDSSVALPLKALGAYTTVVFLYGWVRGAAGEPGEWGILMFSAGWLMFFVTSALVCWRTMQGADAGRGQHLHRE